MIARKVVNSSMEGGLLKGRALVSLFRMNKGMIPSIFFIYQRNFTQ